MTTSRGPSPHAKQRSLRLMGEEPLALSEPAKKQLVVSLATLLLEAAERSAIDQRGEHEEETNGPEDHR